MSDRKWLNLVIFLISVMILLFLILQKSLDRRSENLQPTQFLVEQNFKAVMLRIPVAQIQAEIGKQQWQEFENSWKTILPIAILSQLNEAAGASSAYTIVWDNGTFKRNFKVTRTTDSLFLQSTTATKVIYRYDSKQADLLLPTWLREKTRIK